MKKFRRRHLVVSTLGLAVLAGASSPPMRRASAQAQFNASASYDYYDPENIMIQDVAELDALPTSFALGGLQNLQVGELDNIDYYTMKDLLQGDLGNLRVGDIQGLQQELQDKGWLPACEEGSVCDFSNVLLGDIPDFLDEFIGDWDSILAMPLGLLPNLGNGLFSQIPGIGTLAFFASRIFVGASVVPSMVELIAQQQYAPYPDGVLYVIDRGRPWQVGEARYISPTFRIVLDSIQDYPGTGWFHAELLVCAGFVCWWVPLPWPTAHEQSWHLWVPPTGIAPPPTNYRPPPNPRGNMPAQPGKRIDAGNCTNHMGLNQEAWASAISSIEGGYQSVGVCVRNSDGQGRALGKYQFMTYRRDVIAHIQSKPGGAEWLDRINGSCYKPSGAEVTRFFPPAEQDSFFWADQKRNLETASRQIDPKTGREFTGERLIERTAQIHFAGPSARKIDSRRSDALGRLSVYAYGKTALKNYKEALSKMSCRN